MGRQPRCLLRNSSTNALTLSGGSSTPAPCRDTPAHGEVKPAAPARSASIAHGNLPAQRAQNNREGHSPCSQCAPATPHQASYGISAACGGGGREGCLERSHLVLLPAERAALGQAGLAAGGLAQHDGARAADHHVGGVGEHRGDVHAAHAAHVHEVAVGRLQHQSRRARASAWMRAVFQDAPAEARKREGRPTRLSNHQSSRTANCRAWRSEHRNQMPAATEP